MECRERIKTTNTRSTAALNVLQSLIPTLEESGRAASSFPLPAAQEGLFKQPLHELQTDTQNPLNPNASSSGALDSTENDLWLTDLRAQWKKERDLNPPSAAEVAEKRWCNAMIAQFDKRCDERAVRKPKKK